MPVDLLGLTEGEVPQFAYGADNQPETELLNGIVFHTTVQLSEGSRGIFRRALLLPDVNL